MVTKLGRKFPAAVVANADTQNAENIQKPEPIVTHELSPADMDAVRRNMETLFTLLLHEDKGTWLMNEEKAHETGTSAKELQAIADSPNGRNANGKP
ncbi:hypothetical protein [Corynebacterium macginleyi]|uniref:hypothetical protein n=1 Tax=Corynebacterium macginleyi TaxID=38290 RepID=UPI00190AB920|nr:hypothetical protein [Corynebacterium macginleyi]MBK4145827.1 hypothetical protein [Corynebacterium macginleyi]MBK4152168.1 hypothetical protein [Corynebacterium macginleyi]MBK4161499.1 hypothetical protein [Corynebacterium macginleyi]MBK4180826.1 hypothetical protein [Corynebacterium macginleyi]MBK4182113.1 hypothetical protein [Corynebacterium macginleyi]